MLRLLRKLIAAFEEIDSGPVTLAGTFGKTRLFFIIPALDSFSFSELSKEIQEPRSALYKHGLARDGVACLATEPPRTG